MTPDQIYESWANQWISRAGISKEMLVEILKENGHNGFNPKKIPIYDAVIQPYAERYQRIHVNLRKVIKNTCPVCKGPVRFDRWNAWRCIDGGTKHWAIYITARFRFPQETENQEAFMRELLEYAPKKNPTLP